MQESSPSHEWVMELLPCQIQGAAPSLEPTQAAPVGNFRRNWGLSRAYIQPSLLNSRVLPSGRELLNWALVWACLGAGLSSRVLTLSRSPGSSPGSLEPLFSAPWLTIAHPFSLGMTDSELSPGPSFFFLLYFTLRWCIHLLGLPNQSSTSWMT